MGTYVTQSAFSVGADKKTKSGDKIKRPPLRQFFMDGDFSLAGSLATALTKQALRFWKICADPRKQNVCKFLDYFDVSSKLIFFMTFDLILPPFVKFLPFQGFLLWRNVPLLKK